MPYMIPSGSIYTKLATVASSCCGILGKSLFSHFQLIVFPDFFISIVITCVIKTVYVKEIKYKHINIYVELEKKSQKKIH